MSNILRVTDYLGKKRKVSTRPTADRLLMNLVMKGTENMRSMENLLVHITKNIKRRSFPFSKVLAILVV